ncbi:acetate/propionate family kinase [Butyrivibrio sp. NC3005]|jgi:acetate kinase|uniref:acetate/propionate family kinase n=1 Tax=Butyrivibrio sp. NC3005 TaxID=1280685 RepID=UPI000407CA92|nr:acetate kinase [Butyrivibrio sp. NC3005]
MKVLVINCGSSSLKFQLIDAETEKLLFKGLCERIGIEGSCISFTVTGQEKITRETPMPEHKTAVSLVLNALTETGVVKSLSEIDAVGHRIVHGGEKFTKSVVIDENVIKAIEEVSDLAPLHNPANVIGIRACQDLMPGTPMVAVFDTAFHQTMPQDAYLYGLPYDYYEKFKIRRYGFHGTSHSFVSKKTAELENKDYSQLKTIVCHLGNGASVSAVLNGKCVDTSMGLTPLEGLIMGTRCGSIDPSVIETIEKKTGKNTAEVMKVLNKESGVYGLSRNLSSDFRDLEDGYLAKDENAIRAVDSFCYQVVKYIGAYALVMGGVDCIAFTAGVGENSGFVRKLIIDKLGMLGITLNEEANKVRGEEKLISTPDSKVHVWVVPTNEELAIARDTYSLLAK